MNKNPANIWRNSQKLSKEIGKVGKLIAFTKIFSSPLGFEHQVPYFVGIVEFTNKQKISVEIVDCPKENLKSGLKVQTVLRRTSQSDPDELIEYGIKVKPLK